MRRIAATALLLLPFGLEPSRAWAQPLAGEECAASYHALAAQWRDHWIWPDLPHGGHPSYVESRSGQRHLSGEYEAMHRRLDHGRRLCHDHADVEALVETHIVAGWLAEDVETARGN